jgi:molybdenum cofactor biosynthesis enzyme MoaA
MNIELTKNRDRDAYTFANINLLGKCNVDCFFCLGKDIEKELSCHNQTSVHFSQWRNFDKFLSLCEQNNIKKLYITGQNTDSLMYRYLMLLIPFLHERGFGVGLRTNGFLAARHMSVINSTDLSVGYSIHSLNADTNYLIMKRRSVPNWSRILSMTKRPRISVVINRYNEHQIDELLGFFGKFRNVRYVQMRRVSTDRRVSELMPDIEAYERVYSGVKEQFPLIRTFAKDAEIYSVCGHDVVFWRTTRTSVNSMNYFTDGTISDMYFVVEGYLKYRFGQAA